MLKMPGQDVLPTTVKKIEEGEGDRRVGRSEGRKRTVAKQSE